MSLQDRFDAIARAEREMHFRVQVAAQCLSGMLASVPIVDRMSVDETSWANKALMFADALILQASDKVRAAMAPPPGPVCRMCGGNRDTCGHFIGGGAG